MHTYVSITQSDSYKNYVIIILINIYLMIDKAEHILIQLKLFEFTFL